MASTYSPSLRLELMATGDQSGTWGDTTNTNLGTLLEQAITGVLSVAQGDVANLTLTSTNGASDQARNAVVNLTGALTAARNVVVPTANKLYLIKNSTTGGFNLTVKTNAGTGVEVGPLTARWVYCDGTNVVDGIPGLSLGYTTTATAAGTTTLTVGSNGTQFFTGSTTQTLQMPVTSTLVLGQSWRVVNNSTGVVTVNSSGSNAIVALAANTEAIVTCILLSGTTAASWSVRYIPVTQNANSGNLTIPSGNLTVSAGGITVSNGNLDVIGAATDRALGIKTSTNDWKWIASNASATLLLQDVTNSKFPFLAQMNSPSDSFKITTTDVTFGAQAAGFTPIKITAGTLNTTAVAGGIEYDGKAFYASSVASSRQVVTTKQIATVQGSTVALTNNITTAQSIFASANDALTLAASTTYRFRARLSFNTGNTSHTTAFGFGGTATFTSCNYTSITTSSASATIATPQMLRVAVATATVLNAASTAVTTDVILEGIIRINGAGTVIPQVTFSAGPTGTCETAIDSYFEAEPIGTNTVAAVGNWA